MSVRKPAVAGYFYSGEAEQLKADIARQLANYETSHIQPKAIIVPHAGHCYSGDIAAAAYAMLPPDSIRRVIMLGPSHRVPLQGCAVPSHSGFATPLGEVPVDEASCRYLVELKLAKYNDLPHSQEHSLEVQLPFLQSRFSNFSIVPVVVGQCSARHISELLDSLKLENEDLLLISTDLSHFHSYQQAQLLDAETIRRILSLDPSLSPQDACGCYSVNGFLHFLQRKTDPTDTEYKQTKQDLGWQLHLLKQANSGDYGGSKQEVVGYASFAVY
mgnify:FL=1